MHRRVNDRAAADDKKADKVEEKVTKEEQEQEGEDEGIEETIDDEKPENAIKKSDGKAELKETLQNGLDTSRAADALRDDDAIEQNQRDLDASGELSCRCGQLECLISNRIN